MSPDNRRRLQSAYAIVSELVMNDPEVSDDHPLMAAALELAYLVGYFALRIEEDGHLTENTLSDWNIGACGEPRNPYMLC